MVDSAEKSVSWTVIVLVLGFAGVFEDEDEDEEGVR